MKPDEFNKGEPQAGREQTLGEKRVRIGFNPSSDSLVDKLKRAAADYIDLVETLRPNRKDGDAGEVQRLVSLAQTDIETAAMHAVKAATAPKS